MKKNYPVTQSNQVIEARYRLTRDEQKLLRILISTIRKEDKEFGRFEFSILEIAEIMGINKDSSYQKMKAITKRLMTRVVEVKDDEKKRYIQFSWISIAEYNEGKGTIRLSVHPDLKPFFLSLKGHYTEYFLQNIIELGSSYAIRFYELGKKNIGRRQYETEISLQDLRDWLQLGKTQYKKICNFNDRIMLPAKVEINKHTDITFDYEPVKRGRGGKVVGYTLTFGQAKQSTQAPPPILESVADVIKQLKTIGIDNVRPDTVQNWLDQYGKEKVRIAVEVAQENKARGKPIGAGLIVSALKKNWSSEAQQSRKEKENIRAKEQIKTDRENAKTRAQDLYNIYSKESIKIVKKWYSEFSDEEQTLIKEEYKKQNPMFARKVDKTTSPTSFYLAHLSQLYKKDNALKGFSAWIQKYAKKKKLTITDQEWLAVAEIER